MARRSHDVHVSRNPGRTTWKVTQNGDKISNHRTQAAAVERATAEARRDRADVVTHGRDGKIRSKDSYGNDPNPPRDREH